MTTEMRMRLGFVAVFVLVPIAVQGQNHHMLDSLSYLAAQDSQGQHHVILHRMATTYVDYDNEKALEYLIEAGKLGQASGDTDYLLRNQRAKGQILRRMGRNAEALITLKALLDNPELHSDTAEYTNVLLAIGLTFLTESDFDDALDYFFRALTLAETRLDSAAMALIMSNIGMVYYKLMDHPKAKAFYIRSLMFQPGIGLQPGRMINLTLSLLQMGELDEGLGLLLTLDRSCDEVSPQLKVHLYYAWGIYYFESEDYRAAEDYFHSSLFLAREQDDGRMVLDNLILLADVAEARGGVEDAKRYLMTAVQTAGPQMPHNREKLRIYKSLGRLSRVLGDYPSAVYYQERYIDLRDSIYSDEMITNLMTLESNFIDEQNSKRIHLHKALLQANSEILKGQRRLNFTLTMLGVFMAAFLVLLIKELRREARIRNVMKEQIRTRTQDLRLTNGRLQKVVLEGNLQAIRLIRKITEAINRIRGLCTVGEAERDRQCALSAFRKIRYDADQIFHFLKTFEKAFGQLEDSSPNGRI